MTQPPDLIERVARAMFDSFRHNPPAGVQGDGNQLFEVKAWWCAQARIALTEASAWLTDPTSTKPEGVTRQALNSIDDQKLYREGN